SSGSILASVDTAASGRCLADTAVGARRLPGAARRALGAHRVNPCADATHDCPLVSLGCTSGAALIVALKVPNETRWRSGNETYARCRRGNETYNEAPNETHNETYRAPAYIAPPRHPARGRHGRMRDRMRA